MEVSTFLIPLLPEYYKQLSNTSEVVYSGFWWERNLGFPGNPEFVEAYKKAYKRTPVFHSAEFMWHASFSQGLSSG